MTAFKEEFSKPETLCWQCSKPYLITAAQCPHCLANNANVDLDAAAKQQLATAPGGGEGLLPCGHHRSLLVESVESDYKYCDLCECRRMRNDAEEMERHYKKKLEEAAARLASLEADAERYRWLAEHANLSLGGIVGRPQIEIDTWALMSSKEHELDAAIDAARTAAKEPEAMTSDSGTPRTDAQVVEIYGDLIGPSTDRLVPASFARQLERENAALREKLEQAEQRARGLTVLIKEVDSWVQVGEGVSIGYYIEDDAVKAQWEAALDAEGKAT